MKSIVRYATLIATLLLAIAATAQNIAVREETPITAQSLAGSVAVAPGLTVAGALVEECGTDWSTIESVTLTDERGHFDLPQDAVHADIHYLRVSLEGGAHMLVKVEIRKNAPSELLLSFLPRY